MLSRASTDFAVLLLGIVAGLALLFVVEESKVPWWQEKVKERLAPRHTLEFTVVGRKPCGRASNNDWSLVLAGHEKKGECVTYLMKVFNHGNKTGKPDFVFRHNEHIEAPRMEALKPVQPPRVSQLPVAKLVTPPVVVQDEGAAPRTVSVTPITLGDGLVDGTDKTLTTGWPTATDLVDAANQREPCRTTRKLTDGMEKENPVVGAAWCYSHVAWCVYGDEITPKCDFVGGKGTVSITTKGRLDRINSRVVINEPLRDSELSAHIWGF